MAVDTEVATSKTGNASYTIVRRATATDIVTDITTTCYHAFAIFPACIADILATIPACTSIAVATRFHASSPQHTSSSPLTIVFSIVAISSDL
jgi:cytosine/uracil/thiamine/allantoin permease